MSQTLDAKLHLLISSAYAVLPSIQSLEHHFQVPRPGKKSATGQVKGQLCIGSTQASFVWDKAGSQNWWSQHLPTELQHLLPVGLSLGKSLVRSFRIFEQSISLKGLLALGGSLFYQHSPNSILQVSGSKTVHCNDSIPLPGLMPSFTNSSASLVTNHQQDIWLW